MKLYLGIWRRIAAVALDDVIILDHLPGIVLLSFMANQLFGASGCWQLESGHSSSLFYWSRFQ